MSKLNDIVIIITINELDCNLEDEINSLKQPKWTFKQTKNKKMWGKKWKHVKGKGKNKRGYWQTRKS